MPIFLRPHAGSEAAAAKVNAFTHAQSGIDSRLPVPEESGRAPTARTHSSAEHVCSSNTRSKSSEAEAVAVCFLTRHLGFRVHQLLAALVSRRDDLGVCSAGLWCSCRPRKHLIAGPTEEAV